MEKNKKKESEVQTQKAYVYIVKTSATNDMSLCASDSVFYPGTYVVAPTRYGLDMGVIIGSTRNIETSSYCPGCDKVRGACHFAPTSEAADDDLAALGDCPEFEFKPYPVESPENADPLIDDSHCWDKPYKDPVLVEVDGDIDWIDHMATVDELERFKENTENEKDAIEICKQKIAARKLDMKLVTAHFLLSEPKVMFFFTSEDRVDFRDLVRDLVSVFKMRIELRQIGVRDESRVLGGLAVCGRDFCCHCVSDKLEPVTIKMAKEQNMSLNSMKISGPCGRLLCCLNYEYDFYCEEKMAYPPEGSRLRIGEDLYRVTEINILSHKISLAGSEGREFSIPQEAVFWSDKNDRWEVDKQFQKEFLGI